MLSSTDRALLVAVYFLFTWTFFTYGSIALAGAVVFTVQLNPAGPALLLPAAALVGLGVMSLRSLSSTLERPFF